MTTGSIMFYGGIAGAVLGVIAVLVCIRLFPRQRKRRLQRRGEAEEDVPLSSLEVMGWA